MANKKFTELTDLPSPAGADIMAIVDDVAGTPTTKKVTATNLMTLAPVQSVNTATGAVVLDADDISDASTTNKFVTASDITNLGNLSGTNTGDQDLSSYLQSVSAGDLTDGNFDGTAILGFDASINDQTGTAYTLLSSDNGKVVVLDNALAITVTVPSGLGAGFNCSFVQKGAGQVSFSASSTTINNRQSHTKINAQYGVASLLAYAADTFVLAGDTAS
jgi:hypothetical protein|tara:strand:- start:1805 stop:2461 length:657 start_codon:yes stop_codon:yes gene_type:complete